MAKKMKRRQTQTDDKVRNDTEKALLQRALGFEQQEVYLEDIIDKKSGEVMELTKRKVVKKTIPPDVRALLFWLKNRYPESWRDRVELADDSDSYDFDSDEMEL
ncbi:MAG: hypothetical protein IJW31_04740 [Lentisphaeria bacterium]|nr:hypothetical protein [Lentisphaeria bacterium]